MNDILEELKRYFTETPREQIEADWKKSEEEWGDVGPTVEEFLKEMDKLGNTKL